MHLPSGQAPPAWTTPPACITPEPPACITPPAWTTPEEAEAGIAAPDREIVNGCPQGPCTPGTVAAAPLWQPQPSAASWSEFAVTQPLMAANKTPSAPIRFMAPLRDKCEIRNPKFETQAFWIPEAVSTFFL